MHERYFSHLYYARESERFPRFRALVFVVRISNGARERAECSTVCRVLGRVLSEGHAPWQPASEGWARLRVDDRRLSSATAGVGPPAFQITFLINLFLRLCPISRFHPNKARAFHVSSVRGALHVSASQVSVL